MRRIEGQLALTEAGSITYEHAVGRNDDTRYFRSEVAEVEGYHGMPLETVVAGPVDELRAGCLQQALCKLSAPVMGGYFSDRSPGGGFNAQMSWRLDQLERRVGPAGCSRRQAGCAVRVQELQGRLFAAIDEGLSKPKGRS